MREDDYLICHARLDRASSVFSLRGFGPARRGEGCGVSAPHAEVLLFRQKDPKPLAPGRGPSGAFAPVPVAWAAELASLRQSSPLNRILGTGAQPRPQAPGSCGMECRRYRCKEGNGVGFSIAVRMAGREGGLLLRSAVSGLTNTDSGFFNDNQGALRDIHIMLQQPVAHSHDVVGFQIPGPQEHDTPIRLVFMNG